MNVDPKRPRHGLSLVELLVSLLLTSMIVASLYGVMATVFAIQAESRGVIDRLRPTRFALEEAVRCVENADAIVLPDSTNEVETLVVTDGWLDTYDNASGNYTAAGDGLLDADADGNGLLNDDAVLDPPDLIRFTLDRTDLTNGKLIEERPPYGTLVSETETARRVICDHVTAFACSRDAANLVGIRLETTDGEHHIALRTRARSRRIDGP